MTTYASYLPEDSDVVNDGLSVSFLNCTFEMIAGIAIFSLLFAFSIAPKASTLSMMFFIMPEGIAQFPEGTVMIFGVMFFTLLFMAGLTSSISLLEAMATSLIDKFKIKRTKALAITFCLGIVGSIFFSLPHIIDPKLDANGTLGLTLLDFFDHWAFGYGLLIAGLIETILIGWVFGADKLRKVLNDQSSWHIGKWFENFLKFVVPLFLFLLIMSGFIGEFKGLYGHNMTGTVKGLHVTVLIIWILFTVGGSFFLTKLRGREK